MVDFKKILGASDLEDPEQDSSDTPISMSQVEIEEHFASLSEQRKNAMIVARERREKALSIAKKAKWGAILIPIFLIVLFALISSKIDMGGAGCFYIILTPFICLIVSWKSNNKARKELEIFNRLNGLS